MPRSVLETLVVRIVGEVSSYKRMMRQVPQIAQAAAKQVERTTIRSFNRIGGVIDRTFGGSVNRGILKAAKAFDKFNTKVNSSTTKTWGKFGQTIDSVFGRAISRVDAFGTRMQRRFQLLPRTIGRSMVNVGKSLQRRMGVIGQPPFWMGLGTSLRARGGRPATWSQFRQATASRFRGNMGAMGAAWAGQKLAQRIRAVPGMIGGGIRAVPGMAMRGARALPGLAMAGGALAMRGARGLGGLASTGGAMAIQGARAVPGMAMAGARGVGGAAMAGMRAMPRVMGSAVGMAGAAMAAASRKVAPILRGMLGGLGRGLSNTVGLLAGAFTGRFIPALHSAGRVGNLWYSNFRNQVRRLGYDLTSLGQQISLYVTAPLAALGAFAAVQFARFDDAIVTSMSLLENIGPGTRGAMEKEAFKISAQSRTGPTDLAFSYFHLASAGFEAAEAIGALATVEKFAIAGAFDLNESGRAGGNSLYAMGRATTYLVDTQAALGLRTADVNQNLKNMVFVSDVLTKANIIANARVEDFAKSLTNKGGAALRMVNKDLEEGVAVLAAYAMQGVKAETAGEKLYIVLRDLQRASIKKPQQFARYKISVFDDAGKMRPIVEIIEQLERSFAGLSDQEKRAAFMAMGFQDRSVAATMQLIGMSHHIRRFEKDLRNAAGATDLVANRRLKSLTSQLIMTYNQIRIAAIGVGKIFEPAMLSANMTIRDGVKWWNSLSKTTQKWVVFILAFVAVMGPAVFALGLLAKSLAVVFAGLQIVGALFVAWNPFVLTVLAIAAAIGVLVYLIVGPDGLVGAWQAAIKWTSEFVTQAIGFMENFSANMRILWDWFRNNWQTILNDSINLIVVFTSNMVMNLDVALQTMIRMFVVVMAWIVGQWERTFDTEFGRWAAMGVVNVTVMFVTWVAKMKKLLASIWSGDEVETETFTEKLKKDIEKAATAQTFQQLMDQLADIYNEGMARMRRPLQGMEFKTPAGPKFLLDVPKELEDQALEPIKAMQIMFDDLHDELDEPFNAHFTVSGIEAVQAGTVEALARLIEFRQLKVPSPIQGKITGAVQAVTGVGPPINNAIPAAVRAGAPAIGGGMQNIHASGRAGRKEAYQAMMASRRAMGPARGMARRAMGSAGAAAAMPTVPAEMTAGEKSAAALMARGQAMAVGPPGLAGFGGAKIPQGRDPLEFNQKGIRTDAVEEILKRMDKNIEEQKEFIEKNPNPFMTFGTTSIGANS